MEIKLGLFSLGNDKLYKQILFPWPLSLKLLTNEWNDVTNIANLPQELRSCPVRFLAKP